MKTLGTTTQIASADYVRAVGWLALGHKFPRGETPLDFRERLAAYACASDAKSRGAALEYLNGSAPLRVL